MPAGTPLVRWVSASGVPRLDHGAAEQFGGVDAFHLAVVDCLDRLAEHAGVVVRGVDDHRLVGHRGEQAGQLARHPEGDGQDDDVPVLDGGVGEVHRAGAGLQYFRPDGLGAAGVGHLDVVPGGAEFGGEVPADGTSADDSNFHDLFLERSCHP